MKGQYYTTDLQRRLKELVLLNSRVTLADEIAPAVLDEETQSMPETPEDKVKRNAVPQTDQQHGRDLTQQDHLPRRHVLEAAHPAIEGIEKVGTDPLGQSHMPAVPKLRQIRLQIRR